MIPSPNFCTKDNYNNIRIKKIRSRKIGRKERNFNLYPIIINRSHITYQVKPCYISYKMILVIHSGNTLIRSYFCLSTTTWVKLSGKTAIFRWPYLRSHIINNPKFLRVFFSPYSSICEIPENSERSPVRWCWIRVEWPTVMSINDCIDVSHYLLIPCMKIPSQNLYRAGNSN